MKVKDEMTAKVEVVNPGTSLKEAAQKMKHLNIGALPVCENNRLVGMLTDRDITVRSTAEGKDPNTATVREAMTPGVEWCFDEEDVEEVALKMERKKIRRLPVIDHDKRLVGMLSIGDIAVRGSREIACEILEKVSVAA